MNNSLQIFENAEFGSVRSVVIDGEPWLVGKDVAMALGYTDTDQAIRRNVDEDDKLTRTFYGSGQNRNMTIINESGVYALIMGSKLPNARRFKRWVTSEVLPALCKTKSQELQKPTESEQEAQKNTSKGEKTQMETKMQICGSEITVKEYNGERVVTLADVDTVHQRVEGTARRNFNENRDKLVEGVDYYFVPFDELRTNFVLNSETKRGNPNIPVVLLTESGYLMLVKSLRDDLAWMVQRELVNGYFKLRRVAEAVKQAEEPEDEFDTVCRALQIVDKRAKQLEARNMALESRNDELERKIARDAGKVAYADAVAETKELITVGELAKILYQTGTETGQQRLFKRLCDDGFVMSSGTYKVPQQRAIEAGLLKLVEYTFERGGEKIAAKKTMVTPKGKLYFCKRYGRN